MELAVEGARASSSPHRSPCASTASLSTPRRAPAPRTRRAAKRSSAPPRSGPSVPPGPPFASLFARSRSLQYILRPSVATERVVAASDGLVRIVLKKSFSDGTVAVDMDPLSLLCRLAATSRRRGFTPCATRASCRRTPMATLRRAQACTGRRHAPRPSLRHRFLEGAGASRYQPWAELLRRTFGIDFETCHRCGGRMRLLALVTERNNIARFLRHLGEPTEPPPRAPARDPPYWQSRVLRQHHDGPSRQMGLFEEH